MHLVTQLRTVSVFILPLSLAFGCLRSEHAQHIQSKLVLSFFECGWASLQPVFLKAGMYVITLETFFAVQHKLSSVVGVHPRHVWLFCLFLNPVAKYSAYSVDSNG